MNALARLAGHRTGGFLLFAALFAVLVALDWVGFIASDDVTYATGAYGWIEQFPYLGGHGTIRYTITLPMALSFLTLGGNEVAMALPSLLYLLALFALGWRLIRAEFDPPAAWAAMALLGTAPLFVIQGSIANVDAPELFFDFAGFVLLWRSFDSARPARLLFLAGVACGLAFLTRETAIFVAAFYAVLFVAGYRHPRWRYLWVAAGFLAVWGAELLWLWWRAGDPLYRANISLHHDSTIDRSIDVAGNLIVHPALDPLLVLLFNQEFMLLFWVAIPMAAWLCLGRVLERRQRELVRLLCLFALVLFACTGAAQHLLPLNPRYFYGPTFVAALVAGIGLRQLWPARPRAVLLLALAIAGTNWAGSYVENKDSQFAARTLGPLAARSAETIHADPMTLYRAELPLRWSDGAGRVSARPPRPGDLYYYNPAYADAPNARMPAAMARLYARPHGDVVRSFAPPPSLLARALEASGMAARMPQGLWRKLRYHHPAVQLIRVRAAAQ